MASNIGIESQLISLNKQIRAIAKFCFLTADKPRVTLNSEHYYRPAHDPLSFRCKCQFYKPSENRALVCCVRTI